jgi:hypothetical protein
MTRREALGTYRNGKRSNVEDRRKRGAKQRLGATQRTGRNRSISKHRKETGPAQRFERKRRVIKKRTRARMRQVSGPEPKHCRLTGMGIGHHHSTGHRIAFVQLDFLPLLLIIR